MILSYDDVLSLKRQDLHFLCPSAIPRCLTAEEVAHIYRLCNCFWRWSGNSYDPHARLTSGRCADGFINSRLALSHGNIARLVASQLLRVYSRLRLPKPDTVLSASYGGNDVGAHLAEMMGSKHLFTEKSGSDQIWRSEIEFGELVLPIEELITKGETSAKMIRSVRENNPMPVEFAPVLLTMIRRSELTTKVEGLKVLPVVSFPMKDYDPAECPMCAAGSVPLPPKGDNWPYFQAQMGGIIDPVTVTA